MPGQLLEGSELQKTLFEKSSSSLLSSGYPFLIERDSIIQDAISESDMTASFTVVTRRRKPNRNGHTVLIKEEGGHQGIRLDNFARNPVVLFDHGQSGLALPIGVAEKNGELSFRKLQTKAESTVTFSQILPEAALIFGLVAEGILRTSSISFLPLKAKLNDVKPVKDSDKEVIDMATPFTSLDFRESDLLEWSVVGIPADPDAIKKCLDRGQLNGYKVTQSLRPALENMKGDDVAWSHGFTLEQNSNQQDGDVDGISTMVVSDGMSERLDVIEQQLETLTDMLDRVLNEPIPETDSTGQQDDAVDTEEKTVQQSNEDEGAFSFEALADACFVKANDALSEVKDDIGEQLQKAQQRFFQAIGQDEQIDDSEK